MTKNWQKNKKSYLPTYPIYLEHVTPSAVPRHILILLNQYWISNKYVKQIILINLNWISPTLQKGWELEFCLFFKNGNRVHFSPKKGEVCKIVEEWSLLRITTYVIYLLIFVFINQRNITIPGTYTKVTSFIIHPNFWDKVLSKIQILYSVYR